MTFPPAPTSKIDWSKLDIAVKDEVNGHVEVLYTPDGGWGKPRFVKDPYLRIHGLSPGLNYGQQAYEGMKAYRGRDGQIHLFRPRDHGARLARSAAAVAMPAVPADVFAHASHLATALNAAFVPPHGGGAALYLRPVLVAAGPQLAPAPPATFVLAVYAQPLAPYHGAGAQDALVPDDFDRAPPRGRIGAAKVGGNYAPGLGRAAAAKAAGFGLVLHLDSATHADVDEFSTAGFVGVVDEEPGEGCPVTLVVSDSPNIIQSITTDSVARIAVSFGWKVERRAVKYSELASFSEVIAAGTAAALVPVRSITRKSTGDRFDYNTGSDSGAAGPRCARLAASLLGIMQGSAKDEFGWCERVAEMHLDPKAMLV